MDLLHRLQEMFAIDYAGGRLIVTHLTHEADERHDRHFARAM